MKYFSTRTYSSFRTKHFFQSVLRVKTVEAMVEFLSTGEPYYILGNGSNTLFKNKFVKTPILVNELPKYIECLDNGNIVVSSSNLVSEVLKVCESKNLDSFYYLASVPATIGGAIAMNAGRSRKLNQAIFDYLVKVTFINHTGQKISISKNHLQKSYRSSLFLENNYFIVSAEFYFPPQKYTSEFASASSRALWSKSFQDLSAPNCGSIFSSYNPTIMHFLKGFRLGQAMYSQKTLNWILNKGLCSRSIYRLINLARLLHILTWKKCRVEVRIVK